MGAVRLLIVGVVAIAALVVSAGEFDEAAADAEISGYPDSMAALGDSITQAVNSSGIGNQPQNSWSTGTNAAVDSVYLRILAQNAGISANNFNDSVSGARMTHLNGQAASAVGQGVELVTILMGANDVCTGSEASMTPVATLQSQLETALTTLSTGLPDARIAIGSIPDVFNLWDILHTDPTAVSFWDAFSICQSLLANATSMAPADVQRRANVRQRNIDFNTVLENVCGTYVHCRFDGNAGFNTAFGTEHVAFDYFHPSVAGQALAASVAWNSTYDMSDATAPVSIGTPTASGPDISVEISATDNVGVSGIEYKIDGGAYQRYTAPVVVTAGTRIDWRAVDVNGNSEATQCLAVPDSDIDCVPDGTDNCPAVANEGQANADGDSEGDACDNSDTDGDSFTDETEYFCGSPADDGGMVPERVDGTFAGASEDGDAEIDEPLPPGAQSFDCDGDGYTGAAEDHAYSYIGQLDGDQKTCQEYDTNFTAVDSNQTAATPSLRWPSDFNSSASPLDSFNRLNILDLTSFLAPVKYFGTDLGTNPGDVRWDLTPGKGVFLTDINIQDITAMIAGSSGSPPMLGGAKALFGPVCPWAP